MPTSLTLSRFDLPTYRRSYSPSKYLGRAYWDDRAYVFLKTCTCCFLLGIAPVQRPVRHKETVRIEILRRREERNYERIRRAVKWINKDQYVRIYCHTNRIDTVTLN